MRDAVRLACSLAAVLASVLYSVCDLQWGESDQAST